MKHIKEHRGKFSDKELRRIRSRAISRVKQLLSKRHKKEYVKLLTKEYQKIKRESLNLHS